MGKSKGRGKPVKTKGGGGGGGSQTQSLKGTHKAFKVPVLKVSKTKHKTKAVMTNLKRLNVQNRQQVNQSDNAFTQLQKDMKTTAVQSKKSTSEPSANTSKKPNTKDNEPNMDEATEQMACL